MQPRFSRYTLGALLALSPIVVHAQAKTGVMPELMSAVTDLESKIVGLAKAMPAASYAYRPGKARSTGEVLMHIAADNYFMPAAIGHAAPSETGITGTKYESAVAFENKKLGRDATIAELEKSFTFLKMAMAKVTPAQTDAMIEMFGNKSTTRGAWIMTTTHLHEHLGQMIAYARANNIVPPWSK